MYNCVSVYPRPPFNNFLPPRLSNTTLQSFYVTYTKFSATYRCNSYGGSVVKNKKYRGRSEDLAMPWSGKGISSTFLRRLIFLIILIWLTFSFLLLFFLLLFRRSEGFFNGRYGCITILRPVSSLFSSYWSPACSCCWVCLRDRIRWIGEAQNERPRLIVNRCIHWSIDHILNGLYNSSILSCLVYIPCNCRESDWLLPCKQL